MSRLLTGRGSMASYLFCMSLLLVPLQSLGKQPTLDQQWQQFMQQPGQPTKDFPYSHCFQKAAEKHKLPEALLLAVARGESDFDPNARSHANALGLMQILWPKTAQHLGFYSKRALLKPCDNVDAGARYINQMLARYKGNVHRALAAYNYGPARVPVTGGVIPKGASWYSGYIFRHLDYIVRDRADGAVANSAVDGRLKIISFNRPWRAAAMTESLIPKLNGLRVDWFRRPEGEFDVVMVYDNSSQLTQGKRRLKWLGLLSD